MSVLDVLSSLSSGVIAALVVFWLGTRRDKQNAQEQEKAERTALWRLVDMAIYQNIFKLETIRDSPDILRHHTCNVLACASCAGARCRGVS